MSRVCLVTGANGFVGSAVMEEISRRRQTAGNFVGRGAVRTRQSSPIQESDYSVVGDINPKTDWKQALCDVAVVVHTAARAHVLKDDVENPLAVYRAINVDGTVNLAEQALKAGIRRFVFISSIGVNGNQTFGKAFTADDAPNPQEPYAVSKLEAEVALRRLFAGSQTQLVIIRPPLVYGPKPPGNFRHLLKFVASGFPLPLGAIHNKRSFVALDNLVDLLITCLDHPSAANQTFLVSDDEDLSTTEFLIRMAEALGKRSHLLPVPMWMLTTGAALLGMRDLSVRLCGNLQVDISNARRLLRWVPPITVDEGLRLAVTAYR